MLIGEGSDELFAGYDYYLHMLKRDAVIKQFEYLPGFIKNIIYYISAIIPQHSKYKYLHDIFYKLKNNQEYLLGSLDIFTETDKMKLLSKKFRHNMNKYNTYDFLDRLTKKFDNRSNRLNKLIYVDFKHRLAELLLMRVDKITMANSVEARVPFLDHKLVEFVMKVPEFIKIKNNKPKYLVKSFMKDLIPNEVLARKKQGFGTPVNEWLSSKLGDKLEEIIFNSSIREKNYFDYDFIKELLKVHKKGKRNYGPHLWILLNLSLWYDFWIKKEDIRKKYNL